MNIFAGFSKDGINWEINHEPIVFKPGNTEIWIQSINMTLVSLGLKTVTGLHGATVITDLLSVSVIHSISRNSISARMPSFHLIVTAYCFPQKINGKYAMLSRPSDNSHTPFGDIYISYSPDMKYWGEHRYVMKVTPSRKVPGSVRKLEPICAFPDRRGWLMFYHGVITTCNGFRYSMGAAILDKDHRKRCFIVPVTTCWHLLHLMNCRRCA